MKSIATPRTEAATGAGHSDRILLVEDDLALANLSAKVLTRSGFQVDLATDGLTGLSVLHRQAYDLVITDHRMPGITGVEMVSRLRHEHNEVPVVMASGAPESKEMVRDPSLRISATLPKPFSLHQLVAVVRNVLAHRHPAPAAEVRCRSLSGMQGIQRWGLNE